MAKDVLTKVAAPGQVINVQPGHGTAGRHPTRAFLDALSGHEDPGMFGRMFPTLTPLAVDDTALTELANAMRDADPGSETGNNLSIPAGFTYLGQFVDHDITLDLTSLGDKEADPTAVENFRTPALDLDSVYGLGPDGSRQLYARNPGDADGKTPGPKLLIGRTINVPLGGVTGDLRNDLPRSPEGFALIGDHRNDENLVVAQTHLAMLKFHNKVCDQLASAGKPPETIFTEARQIVTWHYQWMVLHDFVERLTAKGIVSTILRAGPPLLPLQENTVHPGGVLCRRISPRAQHGARGVQSQSHLHSRRRRAGNARALVSIHGTVGRHRRRSRARSADGADTNPGALEQLDRRLAALLRSGRGESDRRPPRTPRASSIRSSFPPCTHCLAAEAACRSAI